ncbi:hypothetical protein [Thioalkalivibrio sp. ALJ24]|uniref:hypothetical protein n=1 Tax=Thioalkalivibrio sp. ALJ24 TaxID=545276 RepID=UPI00037CB109|nr:hypothetical protein [Thioalkalivibrio sp. ALJ24]
MLASLFQPDPVLDPDTREWIRAVFAWIDRQPAADRPFDPPNLILPIREHFPGEANTPHGMAEQVFASVRQHTGMDRQPARLAEPGGLTPQPVTALGTASTGGQRIFHYDPQLIGNRQALVGTFAQELAAWWVEGIREPAPAAEGNADAIAELVATRMGFGVFLANTAFRVRVNGCGACKGPSADRDADLGRDELAWALALFCREHGIPPARARAHLESPLRTTFRKAWRYTGSRQGREERPVATA